MFKRLRWFLLFIALFSLSISLLGCPYIGRLFYPYHFRESIQTSAALHQLDPLFVAAVIHTESGFKPDAVSVKGARGLMQVMPATAEWVALQIGADFSPEMLYDPCYNIKIGCWYLADLYRVFDGNKVIVLAAYNGGRGEVRRWLDEGIWDGSEAELDRIPFGETRNFVRRALSAHRVYRRLYGAGEGEVSLFPGKRKRPSWLTFRTAPPE